MMPNRNARGDEAVFIRGGANDPSQNADQGSSRVVKQINEMSGFPGKRRCS
jgi:hypothetical protein